MAILRWLVQEPGEPEALKDSFEPLFANDCGQQRTASSRSTVKQTSGARSTNRTSKVRKVSNVVA